MAPTMEIPMQKRYSPLTQNERRDDTSQAKPREGNQTTFIKAEKNLAIPPNYFQAKGQKEYWQPHSHKSEGQKSDW